MDLIRRYPEKYTYVCMYCVHDKLILFFSFLELARLRTKRELIKKTCDSLSSNHPHTCNGPICNLSVGLTGLRRTHLSKHFPAILFVFLLYI